MFLCNCESDMSAEHSAAAAAPSKLQLFRPRFSYPHAFDRVKSIDAQWSAVLRNCGGEYAEFAKWGRTEIPYQEGDGVLKI